MAVVSVGERHGVLQVLPSLDAGVLEGVVHGSEAGSDSLGWDLGMDVDDGVGGLGDDPSAPQRPVEIAFGEPEQRVGECDGHEDARVEDHRITSHEVTRQWPGGPFAGEPPAALRRSRLVCRRRARARRLPR